MMEPQGSDFSTVTKTHSITFIWVEEKKPIRIVAELDSQNLPDELFYYLSVDVES